MSRRFVSFYNEWKQSRLESFQVARELYGDNYVGDLEAYLQMQQAKFMLDHTVINRKRENFDPGEVSSSSGELILSSENKLKTYAKDWVRCGNKHFNLGGTFFTRVKGELNPIELSISKGFDSNTSASIRTGINVAQLITDNLKVNINVATCNVTVGASDLLSGGNPSASAQCSAVDATLTMPNKELLCAFDKCLVGGGSVGVKYGSIRIKRSDHKVDEVAINPKVSVDSNYVFSLENKLKTQKK